jgi:thymidylate synthase (FAD)
MTLSRLEIGVIQRLSARPRSAGQTSWTEEDFLAAQDDGWRDLARSRERDECRAKLKQLGMLA